jgi:hypothetical protein
VSFDLTSTDPEWNAISARWLSNPSFLDFEALGAKVAAVQAGLATLDGVDRLYDAIGGRPVAALLANAERGLGKGFLDQDFDDVCV